MSLEDEITQLIYLDLIKSGYSKEHEEKTIWRKARRIAKIVLMRIENGN